MENFILFTKILGFFSIFSIVILIPLSYFVNKRAFSRFAIHSAFGSLVVFFFCGFIGVVVTSFKRPPQEPAPVCSCSSK